MQGKEKVILNLPTAELALNFCDVWFPYVSELDPLPRVPLWIQGAVELYIKAHKVIKTDALIFQVILFMFSFVLLGITLIMLASDIIAPLPRHK